MTSAEPKEFFSTAEAANMLGVAHRTIQLWVEAGILQAWKTAGGHRRIAVSSVERLLAERADRLAPPPVVNTSRQFSVLVVDDDPALLRLYELEMSGWDIPLTILKARDGFDALLQIGRHPPDLLITDLNMPGMDGFRMVATLRGDPAYRQLRIIVISGLDTATVSALGLSGDIPVFTKPVSFARLRSAVGTALVP